MTGRKENFLLKPSEDLQSLQVSEPSAGGQGVIGGGKTAREKKPKSKASATSREQASCDWGQGPCLQALLYRGSVHSRTACDFNPRSCLAEDEHPLAEGLPLG